MFFSIVVPTFSRPDEVNELLISLENQLVKNFEVIIADGSADDSVKQIVEQHIDKLGLKYLYEKGLDISESRNWGVQNAKGDFVVFFDSDCIIPPEYFQKVTDYLKINSLDVWGGPDKADKSFNYKQKSISYAMTSLFTTAGIRGKKYAAGEFQPRSFNMGIRRNVFHEIGGFSGLKVSEDIDLSIRLYKKGYRIGLIDEAYVFHKRRSSLYKFFRQVFSFGSGRIDLQIRHANALKPVHLLPALFVLYILAGLIIGLISYKFFLLWAITIIGYCALIFIDSTVQNHNPFVGLLSIYSSFVMLIGYGLGMIKATIMRFIFKNQKETEKPQITREA
jgi:glycosyltransferase involved in cell wall biosynthesis